MINDRNEARYRSLFENSCDAILLSGSDGTILSANPAACHMLGMSEEEIVRSGIEGITVKDEKFELAVREQHHITKAEITYRRKDGTTFVGDERIVRSSMPTAARRQASSSGTSPTV